MPEGYACDRCGEFSRFTHDATRIEFQKVVWDSGEQGATEKILCPDCGQEVVELIMDFEAPRERLRENGITPPEEKDD